MDETAFAQLRAALSAAPCPFEKALRAGCAACPRAERRLLAEREAITCREAAAQAACATLGALLREKAAFALRQPVAARPLPHALEMKLLCGGLAGLRHALGGGPLEDTGTLAQAVLAAGPSLSWSAVIQAVAAWQPRRRARRS